MEPGYNAIIEPLLLYPLPNPHPLTIVPEMAVKVESVHLYLQ